MREQERVYTTKEISEYLDIGTSTLRKWCLSLEENGYGFLRTDNNKRLFFERDLIALKYYKKLVQIEHFSLGNASKTITSKHKGEASNTRTLTVPKNIEEHPIEHLNKIVLQLLNHSKKQDEYIKRQEQFNNELLEKINGQQKYIEKQLHKRDDKLMQSLREIQVTRKLIAASREDNKIGTRRFWSKLFGN